MREMNSSDIDSTKTGSLAYNKNVMDHFMNPRNVGEMKFEEADGFSITGDSSCGDTLFLWIKVESGRIQDIKFKSFGCPGAIATSSMLTTLAKGKAIAEAKKLTDNDVIRALGGIPPQKEHCSLLGVLGLHNAIKEYENNHK
jgi:nitrogen fixation NifU-like protein